MQETNEIHAPAIGRAAASYTVPTADRFFVIDYETTGVGAEDVPIEVGIVVTDSAWNELDTLEALIYSDYALSLTPEQWAETERLHGIPQAEVRDEGHSATEVAKLIATAARVWKPEGGRLILLSDNICFEWKHTAWLLWHIGLEVTDLFHYCGWDTSLLSLFTSFRDPEGTAHRALVDALGIVYELRRVAETV